MWADFYQSRVGKNHDLKKNQNIEFLLFKSDFLKFKSGHEL